MVKWKEKHPIYGKFVNKTRNIMPTTRTMNVHIGDTVRLMETRPSARPNAGALVEIIEKLSNL